MYLWSIRRVAEAEPFGGAGHRVARGVPRMSTGPRGVLLIDLENMVGQKAGPKVLGPRLDALLGHPGVGHVEVIAACGKDRVAQSGRELLATRGIRFLAVGNGKDAADRALLAEARRQAVNGCRRFLVASGDRIFVELADLGDLEILLWEDQPPLNANAYTRRAQAVHRLPRPAKAHAQGGVSSVVEEPCTARAVDGPDIGKSSGRVGPVPGVLGRAQGPRLLPTDGRLLAGAGGAVFSAGAIFLAGVLFGAGRAVGEQAAERLLTMHRR